MSGPMPVPADTRFAADAFAGFGLLSHDTVNIGDEIQAVAARRFLPRIDRLIPREALSRDPGGPVRLILNGWFMHDARAWPPHPLIDPLPVSIHLSRRRPTRRRFWAPVPARTMLGPAGIACFKAHGPVGARDPATLRLLNAKGIDAYHSGCLSLTLPGSAVPRGDRVVACDLPAELLAALASRTRKPPLTVSHVQPAAGAHAARMNRAEALLDCYAGAKAVVTSRLHCALPCLALGTPVLFIPCHDDPERHEPALALARWSTPTDFLAGRSGFDPEDPPPNPGRHREMAAALVQRCEAFVAGR